MEPAPVHVRAFVSLPDDRENGGGYRLTATVMSDAGMRAELLRDIRLTIARWNQKLHLLDSVTADLLEQVETRITQVEEQERRMAV